MQWLKWLFIGCAQAEIIFFKSADFQTFMDKDVNFGSLLVGRAKSGEFKIQLISI